MNEELEKLLSEFKPRFGNAEDIHIADTLGRLRKLEKDVGAHDKTVARLQRAVDKKTTKEKDIDRLTSSLIWALKNRK